MSATGIVECVTVATVSMSTNMSDIKALEHPTLKVLIAYIHARLAKLMYLAIKSS